MFFTICYKSSQISDYLRCLLKFLKIDIPNNLSYSKISVRYKCLCESKSSSCIIWNVMEVSTLENFDTSNEFYTMKVVHVQLLKFPAAFVDEI